MNRHGQSYDYRKYTFILPVKSPSRNTHHQYDVRRVRVQKPVYSNTTSIPTHITPHPSYQYQSPTSTSDLVEQMPALEKRQSAKRYRSPVNPLPLTYTLSNPNQHSPTNDDRFTNANSMRERLLQDIQRNIHEIDEELSSLKNRHSIHHYAPARLSPMIDPQQTLNPKAIPSSNDENKIWPNKLRRTYQVIPRIPSESRRVSKESTSNTTKKNSTRSFRGQYHYGAEIEETEIRDNDPENSDRRSTVEEISRLRFYESLSLDPYRREQSDLSEHRALISVPEYGDGHDIRVNQSTEDIDQRSPIDTNMARSTTVQSMHDVSSANKLNIQDFQSLIHTAPEPQVEIATSNELDYHESSIQIALNSNSTIMSKPVIHSRQSTRTQETRCFTPQLINNREYNTNFNVNDFLSNFKSDDDDGEGEFISIDPFSFISLTDSKFVSDYTRGDTFTKPVQTSTVNHQSSQQQQQQRQEQQVLIENNTHHIKETEKKKIDPTTKHIATPFAATSSSKKILPNSIYNDNQIHSPRKKNNSNEHQRKTSKVFSNANGRPKNRLNN